LFNFSSKLPFSGYQAFAGLIAGNDGNLYGATIWVGSKGYAVIFRITTSGAYSVLYNSDAPHGYGAYATPLLPTSGEILGLAQRGGAAGKGVVYSFDDGLPAFILLANTNGVVGGSVGILGKGFSTASSVTFNATPASFHVISNTYMTATVPSGETGFIEVATTSGTLKSSKMFEAALQVLRFSPPSGKVGDSILLTGTGLIHTQVVGVGGVKVTSFTVNSDSQVTLIVPNSSKTGRIGVTTPGGSAQSTAIFTVTQ
jgi:hypothetical protein